jgi:hypothetical protein
MGLLLDKLKQAELGSPPPLIDGTQGAAGDRETGGNRRQRRSYRETNVKFPDLETMPPELSLQILKYLNATDLCLAACVWSSLANDDMLWQSLCKTTWGYATIYKKLASSFSSSSSPLSNAANVTYRKVFMQLDEATLTFNADWKKVRDQLYEFVICYKRLCVF